MEKNYGQGQVGFFFFFFNSLEKFRMMKIFFLNKIKKNVNNFLIIKVYDIHETIPRFLGP